jgi:hypothetical protein
MQISLPLRREFIPNDSSCNEVRVDFVELGSDEQHFYIYDPNRNLTDRIPINGGGVEWILGKVPLNDGHKEGWEPVYQATVVSKWYKVPQAHHSQIGVALA